MAARGSEGWATQRGSFALPSDTVKRHRESQTDFRSYRRVSLLQPFATLLHKPLSCLILHPPSTASQEMIPITAFRLSAKASTGEILISGLRICKRQQQPELLLPPGQG